MERGLVAPPIYLDMKGQIRMDKRRLIDVVKDIVENKGNKEF